MNTARTVLITGGNGFIGQHLVARLAAGGHRVTLLQRAFCTRQDVECVPIEELSEKSIARALAGRHFDWVFHLAGYGVHPEARDPELMFRVNVEATHSVVRSATRWAPRSVIIAGSGSEYLLDGASQPIGEDHPLEMRKLYGASKAAGTLWAAAAARAAALPFIAGRIFGVYGPSEAPHRLLPSLVSRLKKAQRVPLTHGRQMRDFLFVDDVIDALLELASKLETRPDQMIVNICSGVPTSVHEFAQLVARELGASPDLLGFGDLPMRADEPVYFVGNPDRLYERTHWRPRTTLQEGIRQSLRAMAVPA